MRILYIDTSSNYLYSAISQNGQIITEIKKELGHRLSEEALQEIVLMFEKAKLRPHQINKIIVVNGPGSFTGIRIGVTIAKVYAWSLNTKITTITSLEAMMLSSNKNTYHVPVIDARRGYVFAAIYDNKYQEILKPQHIKITELEKHLSKINKYEIITNNQIETWPEKETYIPNMKKIIEYFKDKESISPHALNPEYLKLTEAEENKLV